MKTTFARLVAGTAFIACSMADAATLDSTNGAGASTPANGTPAATDAKTKPVTVIDGMDSRRMFDSTDEAAAYLNACSTKFVDFESVPQVLNGIITEGDDAGNFDPAVYTADMRVMVAVLANRGEKGQPSTVKAIVVTPAPTLDAILADESAKNWLVSKVLDKELNHVAVRQLRTADDIDIAQEQMPLSLADYISSSRESVGGIMESFNTLFKGIIAAVAQKSVPWAKARLIKTELKKAMESKAYAAEYYPQLEDRGDKPSLFVMALQLGQREAKTQGLDPAIFTKWLAERDAKVLNAKTTDDSTEEDFDLDSLAFVAEETATGDATTTDTASTTTDAPESDATTQQPAA